MTSDAAPEIWRRREELSRAIRVREGRDPLLESATHDGASSGEPDDPGLHLAHLAEALACGEPALFETFIGWARHRVTGSGRAEHRLTRSLQCSRAVLERSLPAAQGRAATALLDRGLSQMRQPPHDSPGHLGGRADARIGRAFIGALLDGDRAHATRLLEAAAEQGTARETLLLGVLQPALRELGRMWQLGRVGVPQAHHAIETARLAIGQWTEGASAPATRGPVIAACVGAERHDLGLRIVADFLERGGWSVVWLGSGTSTGTLVEEAARRDASIVALSASIGMHLRDVRAAVRAIRESPACGGVRVLVGGEAFRAAPGLAERVGADRGPESAEGAAAACASLLDEVPVPA